MLKALVASREFLTAVALSAAIAGGVVLLERKGYSFPRFPEFPMIEKWFK